MDYYLAPTKNPMYTVMADKISPTPKTKKCIVLDLDQTLIATQDKISSIHKLGLLSDPKVSWIRDRTYCVKVDDIDSPGEGITCDFWGLLRPYTQEFLLFCFSYFELVCVWSAGKRDYVEAMVDVIFKDLPQPHVVFTYDDVVFDANGKLRKPLTKMMSHTEEFSRKMKPENCFILDDNKETFRYNVGNAIHIPPYNPKLNKSELSREETALLQVKSWLMRPDVAESEDVRKLDKSGIFEMK